MASLKAIRDGLQTQLQTIAGLHVYDVADSGELVSPAAVILPAPFDFDAAAGDTTDWTLHVHLFAQAAVLGAAQDQMDDLVDPSGATSVRAAVDADVTLGGNADSTRVVRMLSYRLEDGLLQATLQVEVLT